MKFLVPSQLNKNFFEFSLKQLKVFKLNNFIKKLIWQAAKGILNLLTLFLRFMFLQPRLVRQISPGQFEEAHVQKSWTGQFYV
jgi:hypothetical protein